MIRDAGAPTSISQYSYIGSERVLERQYQNGTRLTYLNNTGTTDIGYDALRRTVQRRDVGSGNSLLVRSCDGSGSSSPLVGFCYAYDRENNKSNEIKLHSPANSELYTYDSVYRITDFQRPQTQECEQWPGLDGVSNWRLHKPLAMNCPTVEMRQVNTVNEYTMIDSNNLIYDRNGNLTTGLGVAYQWDYKNRLRQVCSVPANATSCSNMGAVLLVTYSYDAMNRRTRKVVTNSGVLNGITNFYYDNWQTIEEQNGSDALTQQYVYGIYIDEPLVLDRSPSGQRLFYHQNTLYSTFALTDSGGAVVEGYQYDAYGRQTVLAPDFTTVTGTVSAFGNPYMFTGQRLDAETGLLYYKNRYYSASLGRFLQRDPLGYVDSMNLYAYVGDRPTLSVDPSGLCGRRRRGCTCDCYQPGNEIPPTRPSLPTSRTSYYQLVQQFESSEEDGGWVSVEPGQRIPSAGPGCRYEGLIHVGAAGWVPVTYYLRCLAVGLMPQQETIVTREWWKEAWQPFLVGGSYRLRKRCLSKDHFVPPNLDQPPAIPNVPGQPNRPLGPPPPWMYPEVPVLSPPRR
jgi:RHS repeat-associated protein